MAGTVHALLVGIDRYPDPGHRLDGCRNDVEALAEYLKLRIPGDRLRLHTLVDDEATREGVIGSFRDHLGRAGADDTALFYYAGHGSRERAPEAFWTIEPDRLDETLVLFDSRTGCGHDLADKEMAVLLRELEAKGPRIVVILDACHSGSGTRAASTDPHRKVRRFPMDARERAIETFLPEVQALVPAAGAADSGWDFGTGARHILLAACRDDEEAAEHWSSGRSRGVFTHFLLAELVAVPGTPTYRDLAAAVRARVLGAATQTPQVECTHDGDLNLTFLGSAIQPRPASLLLAESAGDWWLDAGRLHGMPAPVDGECARVAIHAAGTSATDLAKVGTALAIGEVREVLATKSRVDVTSGSVAPGSMYTAVVIGTPVKSKQVTLEGDATELAAVREELVNAVFVREAADAEFRLECAPGRFTLRRAVDGLELVAPEASAADAVRVLEHVARWHHFAELENPLSGIGDDEIEWKILAGKSGNEELPGADVRLTARRTDAGLEPPEFRISVCNRGRRDLYVGLLALDELYACASDLFVEGVRKLRPGDAPAWALDGKALKAEVPTALRAEGRNESRDVLKLVVSTTDFNIRHANLAALRAPPRRARQAVPAQASTLERLLARSQARTISASSQADEVADFRTRTAIVTTIEPAASVQLSDRKAVEIGSGVRIGPHAALHAQARLAAIEQTRSDLGAAILPPLFRGADAGETVQFTARRGANAGLSVLVLEGVSDHLAVTPKDPLLVDLPVACAPSDVVLAVAYDGEDYLVLGHGSQGQDGTTITLSRLPHPVSEHRRSLAGSIKILFQKFSAGVLGAKYEYPILAAARWSEGRKASYDADVERLRDLVKRARRVVVFVHGIIGDTLAMGARLPPRAGDAYLAFDYENLHTTIEENAAELKRRLADCGLTPGHGKELVLVAHSMGGLVTRWFVEQLGGNQVVTRAVLCGTPNAGSNWASIEDMVTGMASLALNGLTKLSWEAALVASLFSGLEKIDRSLDEMRPGSEFLIQLSKLGDPGIAYTILAGNTSLHNAADGNRVQRVLKKVLHQTASLAFLGAANDIAASVESIGAAGAGWSTKPQVVEVACDHLSYFSSDAGLAQLRAVL